MYNSDLPTRAELPSSKQLLRSTVIAIITAAVVLVTLVLPAEYGIDPTRIGRALGLTQMGTIKMARVADAELDRAAPSAPASGQTAGASPRPPAQQGQSASIAPPQAATEAKPAPAPAPGQTARASPRPPAQQGQSAPIAPAQAATNATPATRTDETTVTLKPGEGTEVKMEMSKGAKASYEWTTAGGPVNHDTHVDNPNGGTHSYRKGQRVERDAGEITAVFDGYHGWFWRNRGNDDVTIALKTSGEYRRIKRM